MTSYFKIHSVKKKRSILLDSEVLDYQIQFLTGAIDSITDFDTLTEVVDTAFDELFAFLIKDLPDSGNSASLFTLLYFWLLFRLDQSSYFIESTRSSHQFQVYAGCSNKLRVDQQDSLQYSAFPKESRNPEKQLDGSCHSHP